MLVPTFRPRHWCSSIPPDQSITNQRFNRCDGSCGSQQNRPALHAHVPSGAGTTATPSPLHEQSYESPAATFYRSSPGRRSARNRPCPYLSHTSDQRVQCDGHEHAIPFKRMECQRCLWFVSDAQGFMITILTLSSSNHPCDNPTWQHNWRHAAISDNAAVRRLPPSLFCSSNSTSK